MTLQSVHMHALNRELDGLTWGRTFGLAGIPVDIANRSGLGATVLYLPMVKHVTLAPGREPVCMCAYLMVFSIRELEFVTVLAWSCCDVAYPDSRVQYARTCGWRKVQ